MERGNEGRAFLREQILFPDIASFVKHSFWWRYNLALYFAISCGAGLHRAPYGFIEVYKALQAICNFWEKTQPIARQFITLDTPASLAWHLTTRALTGTNGAGGAYLKNIVYLEGNINCWRIGTESPAYITRGDIGKFDIANQKHLDILQGLSIIE